MARIDFRILVIVISITASVWIFSLFILPELDEGIGRALVLLVRALMSVVTVVAAVVKIIDFADRRLNLPGGESSTELAEDTKGESKPLPCLKLRVFRAREHVYRDEISFEQSIEPSPLYTNHFGFCFALENSTKETIARGLYIRVEFSWAGNDLKSAPRLRIHRRSKGWTAKNQLLRHNRPAVLVYRGGEERCPFGHPLEWYNFDLGLWEKVSGFFRIDYEVTSAQPETFSSGTLKMRMV